MPVYEYQFIETGNIIEISHSMKDDALKEYLNPETNKIEPVKRLISGNNGLSLGKVYKGYANVKNELTYKKKSSRD